MIVLERWQERCLTGLESLFGIHQGGWDWLLSSGGWHRGLERRWFLALHIHVWVDRRRIHNHRRHLTLLPSYPHHGCKGPPLFKALTLPNIGKRGWSFPLMLPHIIRDWILPRWCQSQTHRITVEIRDYMARVNQVFLLLNAFSQVRLDTWQDKRRRICTLIGRWL